MVWHHVRCMVPWHVLCIFMQLQLERYNVQLQGRFELNTKVYSFLYFAVSQHKYFQYINSRKVTPWGFY